MYSTSYAIGVKPADANGQVVFTWTLPANITAGLHYVELTGAQSGSVSVDFIVAVIDIQPTSGVTPAPGGPATGGKTGTLSNTGALAPAGLAAAGLACLIGGSASVILTARARRQV